MKKTTKSGMYLPLLTLALLCLGALSLLFFPTERFSQKENRFLTDFPVLKEAIKKKTLAPQIERYCTDRFPLRQTGQSVRAVTEMLFLKSEVDDILLCRDGSLSAKPRPSDKILQKNISAIMTLTEDCHAQGKPFTLAVLPQRVLARQGVLPRLYRSTAHQAPMEMLSCAVHDTVFPLNTATDDEWFRTDHHWTASGAYRAYVTLGSTLGYTPFPESAFKKTPVCDRFLGSADAAAGLPFTRPDDIVLWRYENDDNYLIHHTNAPDEKGFYRMEKLQTRDGYGVFLGDNIASYTVDLGKDDARPVLLLYKDSFANALVPFLARHFRLHVVDPRYAIPDHTALLSSADQVLVLAGMLSLSETGLFP